MGKSWQVGKRQMRPKMKYLQITSNGTMLEGF